MKPFDILKHIGFSCVSSWVAGMLYTFTINHTEEPLTGSIV